MARSAAVACAETPFHSRGPGNMSAGPASLQVGTYVIIGLGLRLVLGSRLVLPLGQYGRPS